MRPTVEQLTDPVEFAKLATAELEQLDDEAILANASWVAGKGEEYIADWYERLAQSIQSRREEPGGVSESEGAQDGGPDAAQV